MKQIMMRRIGTIIFISAYVALLPVAVDAADSKNQGLLVSPIRQEITLSPGHPVPVTITLGDLSDKPMKIDLNIKQFSVTDYNYKYQFRPLEYDWIKFADSSVTLQPGQKKQIHLTITAPTNAATGGYYFAFFASTRMADSGVKSTVQVGSLLYTKIEGDKARRAVTIEDVRVPSFVTGGETPFRFNIRNTGNVHLEGHFFAQMEGLLGKSAAVKADHILLPETIRTISGVVPNPVLPGIYKLTYGYKVDASAQTVTKSVYVLFIPPWFFVVVLVAFLVSNYVLRRRKQRQRDNV